MTKQLFPASLVPYISKALGKYATLERFNISALLSQRLEYLLIELRGGSYLLDADDAKNAD